MKNNIKQHYVPRSYLQFFTYDATGTGIYCYDKKISKQYVTGIKEICYEKGFYKLKGIENEDVWDDIYTETVDPVWPIIIRSLISKYSNVLVPENVAVINDTEKYVVATFLVAQLYRSTGIRELISEMDETIINEALNRIRNDLSSTNTSEDALQKIYDINQNEILFQSIMNIEIIKPAIDQIMNKKWEFYQLRDSQLKGCISCDNPVVVFNNMTQKANAYLLGLDSRESSIVFPFSPKLCLLIDGKNSSDIDCAKKYFDIDKCNLFNRLLFDNAIRYVYSNNNELLSSYIG